MNKINDIKKLLDNGWQVLLFSNDLGSYTAVAIADNQSFEEAQEIDRQITDDHEPEKALYRLAEKVTTGRIVCNDQEG